MQIKSIIKTNNNKNAICSWIIENFPENYENMNYVEPFVGNGIVLLNKKKSIEEVAGDLDEEVLLIWKTIKNNYKNFKTKISKVKYSEKFFNEILGKKSNIFNEFILRKMSKLANKKSFDPLDRKKANVFWKQVLENSKIVQDRIKDTYFIKKPPLELIIKFDGVDSFCFCGPPSITDKQTPLSTDDYVNITEALLDFRGKVVFLGNNCSFYKRVFKEWKIIKRKTSNKNDCLWVNF
jgi:site-specific DNA-adenine methylase